VLFEFINKDEEIKEGLLELLEMYEKVEIKGFTI